MQDVRFVFLSQNNFTIKKSILAYCDIRDIYTIHEEHKFSESLNMLIKITYLAANMFQTSVQYSTLQYSSVTCFPFSVHLSCSWAHLQSKFP